MFYLLCFKSEKGVLNSLVLLEGVGCGGAK